MLNVFQRFQKTAETHTWIISILSGQSKGGGGHWKHPLGEANKREGNRSASTREHATVEDFRLSEGLLRSLAVLMLMS